MGLRNFLPAFLWCVIYFAKANNEVACPTCRQVFFKENKNQWHEAVKYQAEVRSGQVFLENTGLTYLIIDTLAQQRLADAHHGQAPAKNSPDNFLLKAHAIKVQFEGANATHTFAASDKTSEYFNYFIGRDPKRWASRVYAYGRVRYQNLYAGIDLVAYSSQGNFKYDFIVQRGADVAQIKMRYEGADKIALRNNMLRMSTSVGEVVEMHPYAYQIIDGQKTEVPCQYALEKNIVHFHFPKGYNRAYTLTIDPTLIFSTYSGSFADNFGYTATYDSRGNAYAAGSVFQFFSYPTTPGAFQTSWAGGVGYQVPSFYAGTGTDMAITKYDSAGITRIFSTYFGGNKDDLPHSMVVNSNDELLIYGTTGSTNFPVTPNAYDTSFNGGINPGQFTGIAVHYNTGSDIVVARFSTDGTQLLGSTYVGGSGNDGLNYPTQSVLNYNYADEIRGEIDLDDNNNVVIATCTNSPNFPITNQTYQSTFRGGIMDGCVFKLNSTLSQLVWSTYLGGSSDDAAYSIAFDKNKDIYVCGGTRSPDFPTTTGALKTTFNGGRADGFIAHLSKDGKQLLHSTYYGSPTYDQTYFVECSKQNHVYVLGQTMAVDSTFIKNSHYNRLRSGQFISKLGPALDTVEWSNVFGSGRGTPDISPTAFLVDLCNKVYVSGWGSNLYVPLTTAGLDTTVGAFQSTTDNQDFYIMVMEDDASLLNYATYFGSPHAAEHVDGGTSRFDRKGVIYQSVCAGCGGVQTFPTAPANVVSRTNNSPNCNNALFKFDFNFPIVVADFITPPAGCAPHTVNFLNTSKSYPTSTFQWFFGDGSSSTFTNPTHTYTQQGLFTVTLVVFDPATCNITDTLKKQILILKSQKDTLATAFLCSPAPVQVGFPPTNDTSIVYRWTPSLYLSDTNISNPISTADSSIQYIMYASNGICIDTFYQSITVFDVGFSLVKDSSLCPSDTGFLRVMDAQNLPNLTYTWTLQQYILSGNNTANVLVKPPTDTVIQVLITDPNGCFKIYSSGLKVFQQKELHADFTLPLTGCVPVGGVVQNLTYDTTSTTTYFWDFGDGFTSTQFSPAHIWSNPGIFPVTLTVRDPNQFCQPIDSVTKYFIATQNNQTTVLPNDTLCFAQSKQIAIDGVDTTATLRWQPSVGLSDSTIAAPFAMLDTSTTYVLNVMKNGCNYRYQIRLVVLRDSLVLLSDTSVCPGDTLTLRVRNVLSSIPFSYAWSPVNLIIGSNSSDSVRVSPPRDTTFTAIAQNNYGCVYTKNLRVHVAHEKVLHASFTSPSSGCLPFTTQFTNTSAALPTTQYMWQFGDGGTSTSQTPTHTYINSGVFQVTLIISDTASCNLRDTATKPILLLDSKRDSLPDKIICAGGSVQIGVNGLNDSTLHFLWKPSTGLSNDTIANPVASPKQNTTYLLIVNNNTCLDTFSQRVKLFSSLFRLSQDSIPCPKDTFHIRASNSVGVGGISYQWWPVPLIVTGNNTPRITARTPQDTFFYVIISDSLGCTFLDSIRALVRDEEAVRPNFKAPLIGCVPFTASFTNTSQSVGAPTFQWRFGDGTGATTANPVHTYTAVGTYTVTLIVNDPLARCAQVDSVQRVVTVVQNFQTVNLPNDTICFGSGTSIGPSVGIDSTTKFRWSPNYNLSNDSVANPIASPEKDTTYRLRVNQSNCTFDYVQRMVVRKDSVWITGTDPACDKKIVTLNAHNRDSTNNGLTYQWAPAQLVLNGQGTDQVVVQPPVNTLFNVTITDSFGCVWRDTIAVNVFTALTNNVSAFAQPDTILVGDTAQLQAIANVPATIVWRADSTLSNFTISNPKAFPENTRTYYVTFTDENACKREDTVVVVVLRTPCGEAGLFVPNAFTPNGDGRNDVFRVRGNNITGLRLVVYDRWGQLMFETHNMNEGWDGTFNGAKLDPAVFAWYVEGTCDGGEHFFKKGNVTLLR